MTGRGLVFAFLTLGGLTGAHAADADRFDGGFPEDAGDYVAMSIGAMVLDLPDVAANALAVDGASGPIDLSPDLDAAGPVLGISFGKQIDLNGHALRLVGSGFYGMAFGASEVAVAPDFGAFGWQGIWSGNAGVYAAADLDAGGGAPAAIATAGATSIADGATLTLEAPIPDPLLALALGIAVSDLGSAYGFAGNTAGLPDLGLGALDVGIAYARTAAYYGGELAVEHDVAAAHDISVRTGAIYRGLDIDLATTVSASTWVVIEPPDEPLQTINLGATTTLSETLEADYVGWLFGATASKPIGNGAVLDLGLSAAPMVLGASYAGYETHLFRDLDGSIFGPFSTPTLTDADHRFAGLVRARAAVRVPVIGAVTFELAGEIEYLSAVPTIVRAVDGLLVADTEEAGVEVGDCCGEEPSPLAALGFVDMLALSLNARLELPIGAE